VTEQQLAPKTFFLDPSAIKLRDRIRKRFDEKKHEELKKSIAEKGQIHPSVLDEEGYLISGERRMRACNSLGIPVLCIQRADLDATAAFELELEENLTREDLTPQEVVLARASLYKLKGGGKPRLGGAQGPTLDEIASQMGITKGQLSQDLKIAQWLPLIKELEQCSTKAEMLAKIKHLEAQCAWHQEVQRIQEQSGINLPVPSDPIPSSTHLLDRGDEQSDQAEVESERPNPLAFMELRPGTPEWKQHWRMFPETQNSMLEFSRAWERGEEWEPPPELLALQSTLKPSTPQPVRVFALEDIKAQVFQNKFRGADKRLVCGDSLEYLSEPIPWGRPTIVIWDPPWGIDHDIKLAGLGSAYDTYEDNSEYFQSLFSQMVPLLFSQMAEHSHLYCFFSITNLEFIYQTLESAGFQVNRRPIIWTKPGIRSTRAPETWPGAGYEPIAFARKGSKPLIQKKSDFIEGIKPPPPSQKGHPAAKPPELYMDLLARSACVQDFVFDPCFGSGPLFRACELLPQLQLTWAGCEKEETWKNLALVKLMELWQGKKEGELSDKLDLFSQ
jgi:ParB/RepB/Spo0J family partition protein